MLSPADFHEYQPLMLDRLLNPIATDTENSCGWAGMGLGKTVVGLTAVDELLKDGAYRALVVSTKKAAEHTWAFEHQQWSHLEHQGRHTKLLTGTPAEREALLGKGRIHIINQENLPWLVRGYGIKNWPYDIVFIDDCKGLKAPGSVTYRALRHIMPVTKKIVNLTGTPMPNGYIQIWPQIYLMDYGTRLGKSHSDFKRFYFEQSYNGYAWIPKTQADIDKIDSKISDVAFSVNIEDYIDNLPIAKNRIKKVHLPGKLRRMYDTFEKDFYLALEDGQEAEAGSLGILHNKLSQMCNGAIYTDPQDPLSPYSVVHDLKLDALEEVIEEMNGENLIVAYSYLSDWERIKKRFPEAVHINHSKSAIDDWNKGRIPLLCCHPGSAGHGLNLQFGGRTIVWFGSNDSLELVLQMDERVGAVRQVQSKLYKTPVYVRIVIADSMEDDRAQSLADKDITQQKLIKKVKLGITRRART